jgi:hypothetical protein
VNALSEKRETEETTSSELRRKLERWLVVSEPLAIDDDPHWDYAEWGPDHEVGAWSRAPRTLSYATPTSAYPAAARS